MRAAPPGSAAVLGGLVNMARGIGASLGIALVTLALHVTRATAAVKPGSEHAFALLAISSAAAAVIALTAAGPGRDTNGEAGPYDAVS
jgi:hypothetical protein